MTPSRLEALLYDWECDVMLKRQMRDAPFFDRILRNHIFPGGRISVLGCGTGRVAIPLAGFGWRVVGMDISPERLALARNKAAGPDAPGWLLGDMRDVPAEPCQDAVIIPYSAFLLLQTDADRLACLTSIRRSLKPQSVAVIDVSPNFLSKPERLRAFVLGARASKIGGWVDYFETVRQQRRARRTLIGRRYRICLDDGGELRAAYLERWLSLTSADAESLATKAGLRIVAGFADYDATPLFAADGVLANAAKHIYVMTPIRDN